MDNFLLLDFIIKMFYAVLALFVMWMVLRLRDRLTGVDFKEKFKGVADDPKAYAVYLGGTAIAVAELISTFF